MNFENKIISDSSKLAREPSVDILSDITSENDKVESSFVFNEAEGSYVDGQGTKWKLASELAKELNVSFGLIERAANGNLKKLKIPATKRPGVYCDEDSVRTHLKDFITLPEVNKETGKYIDPEGVAWVTVGVFAQEWEASNNLLYRKVARLNSIKGRDAGGKEANFYRETELIDLVGKFLMLPSVDEETKTYIDRDAVSWMGIGDAVKTYGVGQIMLRSALESFPSVQGKESRSNKEMKLYRKDDIEEAVKNYFALPDIDENTGRFIDESNNAWVPLTIYADETGLDRAGIARASKNIDTIPSRHQVGCMLYREDELNERFGNIANLPKIDPENGRFTDQSGTSWIGVTTAINETGLGKRTVWGFAKSLPSIRLKNSRGVSLSGYPEDELMELLTKYQDLPQVDSKTGKYTDENNETWLAAQTLISKYSTVAVTKHFGSVRTIDGRSRRDESTLYNEQEVDEKMLEYSKLARLDSEEKYVDGDKKLWSTINAVALELNVGSKAVRDRASSMEHLVGVNTKGHKINVYPYENIKQAFINFPYREINNRKITVESLSEFLTENSKGSFINELIQLSSLFGASNIVDILFASHPEYRGLPMQQVKSALGEYLGDFLISPPPFNVDLIEKGIDLLESPNFQAGLTEVIKSSCLAYLHDQKQLNRSQLDLEIVRDYIAVLREKAISLQNNDFFEVLKHITVYFDSVFNGIQKPKKVIDSLRSGRDFPDTFQKINIQEIRTKKRMLLADEMGIGKSASAILAKESLGLRRAIVIVPSNVLGTWEGYLSDRTRDSGDQEGYFKPGEAPTLLRVKEIEDLDRPDIDSFEYVLLSHERLNEECVEKLKTLNADMLIVDEVHKLKNVREGSRSKSLIELSDHLQGEEKYLVALSGTPIPNKVEDIAVSLKLLYPEQFSEVSNKELVSQIIQSDVLTLRNLLVQRMQMKSLAESVEMPPLNEQIVMSELSETEKELYQVLLEEDEVTASTKMALLRTFLLNPAALDAFPSIESTKQNDLKVRMNDFFARKDKMVVFVNGYIEGVIRGEDNFISDLHLPEGVVVRVIDGSVTTGREEIQAEFQETNGKILLIVSGQTADVGIDLSAAQGVIEYNEPWTMADKRQQVARAHRYNLKEELEYVTFVTRGTIEEGIHEYILEKERVITKLIKGIPITEIERGLISEAEKLEVTNLEVNPELAEYYFSSWNKLMQIFASVKELGEVKFSEFITKYGEDYAECYSELGSRSYQSNVNRVAGTLITIMAENGRQPVNELAVLDAASGPEMLLRHAPHEIQSGIVSMDRNPFQFRGSDSGRALAGSFTKLPLQSGSFDYVNLALGLHYTRLLPSKEIYERLEVLMELNRVLKEGGKAVISFIYSLDLKDEAQFENILEAFGFHIVPEYTGEATSGENYKTKVMTLEKRSGIKDSIGEIVDILLEGELDGIKFSKSDRRLKDSRRTIDHFELKGSRIDIRFNDEDFKAYKEEYELTDIAEQMKMRAGGEIKDIPADEIIRSGFTRFFNGKRYVLYKKLSSAPGSIVVR